MKELEGGCSVPLGVNSKYSSSSGSLSLRGGVFAFDGDDSIVEEHQVAIKETILRFVTTSQMCVQIVFGLYYCIGRFPDSCYALNIFHVPINNIVTRRFAQLLIASAPLTELIMHTNYAYM